MNEYLSDFVCEFRSTTDDQLKILEHWGSLFLVKHSRHWRKTSDNTPAPASPMVLLFDNFYKFLFELVPEVKPMFRSSMHMQGKALIRITGSIKSLLMSPDLVAEASALAERHIAYGVKLEHFNSLGIVLMKTLESCSPVLWTDETAAAWKSIYGHVALIVVSEIASKTGK